MLDEGGGSVGTSALEARARRRSKHASLADLPVDEIIPVADTVVGGPEPANA